jgi:hypothetical protein
LVSEIAESMAAEIRGKGLVELSNRVDALNERWDGLQQVIKERAMASAEPGAGSGLLVRTFKQIGSGDFAKVVEEYAVDTGLLKAPLDHEKQAAQELGQ